MDQMNSVMLNLMQELTKIQTPNRENPKDGASFEDMMAQHRQDKKAESEPTEKSVDEVKEKPQEEVQKPEEDEGAWREQMAAAAMAVLPVQIVPVETLEVQEVVETVAPVVQMAETAEPEMAMPQAPVEQELTETVAGPETAKPQEEMELPQQEKVETAPVAQQQETIREVKPQTRDTVELTDRGDESDMKLEVTDAVEPQQSIFGEVEAAPVKVGETQAPMKAEEPESVDKQVMKPLAEALEKGETRVEIQLTPENLGTVTIELTRNEDGALHVLLTAESPRTQSLLDRHATMLQSALFDQNQEPVRVEVQHTEPQQHNPDYQEEQNQNSHQQEQRHQQSHEDSQDFLQQLRLGLTPLEAE